MNLFWKEISKLCCSYSPSCIRGIFKRYARSYNLLEVVLLPKAWIEIVSPDWTMCSFRIQKILNSKKYSKFQSWSKYFKRNSPQKIMYTEQFARLYLPRVLQVRKFTDTEQHFKIISYPQIRWDASRKCNSVTMNNKQN